MRSKGFSSIALVSLIAGAWLLGSPLHARSLQKQKSPVAGPEGIGTPEWFCSGPKVGNAIIKDLDNGDTKFKVKFTSGPARRTYDVFWLCNTAPSGCHESVCGNIYLGSFTTDATGEGKLKTILPGGNPFPGKFVHVDFFDRDPRGGGAVYSSTLGAVPAGASSAVAGAVAGDPVQ